MQETADTELLRQYVEQNSEAAFADLVVRYINLVYSAAARKTGSLDAAEEITQAVFIILARKAKSLRKQTILSGWLYQTARLTAANFLRNEIRRARREKEAHMQSLSNETEPWPEIEPLLEDAMGYLNEKERNAIVLRFFEGRSFQEIGAAFGGSENAAKKRVIRGLEKLRKFFARRGMSSTTAIIGEKISAHSLQAAPAALAKSVTALAVAKGAAGSVSTLSLVKGALKFMAWTKAKTAMAIGAGILLAGGTAGIAVKTIASSRQEAAYEMLFANPDPSSMSRLEQTPPALIVRPTRYPNGGNGIWTQRGKALIVNVSMNNLLAWAYGADASREVLPENLPRGGYDYLNTLPNGNDALRQRIKKQFGLVARRQVVPTDVLALVARDPARLNSYRNRGAPFACNGIGSGNMRGQCFTNAPLSLLVGQIVEGYFQQPCVDETPPKAKYDFAIQWEEPEGLTGDERRKALQPVMKDQLNQLGLDLVPTNMPVEMLVVEKAK